MGSEAWAANGLGLACRTSAPRSADDVQTRVGAGSGMFGQPPQLDLTQSSCLPRLISSRSCHPSGLSG